MVKICGHYLLKQIFWCNNVVFRRFGILKILLSNKSSFLFVFRFKSSSEDGRKSTQDCGAEVERTRQLFNRELVSTVLKVCLLLGIRCQQVFSRMYGSKGFLNFAQVSQWQLNSIGSVGARANASLFLRQNVARYITTPKRSSMD
jgi:hypothetical protein